MYNSRIGRRTRRISDSKDNATLHSRTLRDMRVKDADDDEDVEIGGVKLTTEEVQGLLELLPYKEALIKIAKGEFEIEKVEEADDEEAEADAEAEESEGSEAEEENFEEDEDFSEEGSDDEGDYDEDEDYDEDSDVVGDSAINDAWTKRLSGNSK